jgi:hypothetical protein
MCRYSINGRWPNSKTLLNFFLTFAARCPPPTQPHRSRAYLGLLTVLERNLVAATASMITTPVRAKTMPKNWSLLSVHSLALHYSDTSIRTADSKRISNSSPKRKSSRRWDKIMMGVLLLLSVQRRCQRIGAYCLCTHLLSTTQTHHSALRTRKGSRIHHQRERAPDVGTR